MITLNIVLTVRDAAQVEKVRDLLSQAAALSRQEPGCLRFEAYHSEANPQRFFLNEHWESQESLDAHRKNVAYTTIYQPQVLALADREGHPCKMIL